MSRSAEEIAAAVGGVVGDVLDDVEFADLMDRIKFADEAGELLTGQDLTPVTIEGGEFEVYRDGSYCLKADGRIS